MGICRMGMARCLALVGILLVLSVTHAELSESNDVDMLNDTSELPKMVGGYKVKDLRKAVHKAVVKAVAKRKAKLTVAKKSMLAKKVKKMDKAKKMLKRTAQKAKTAVTKAAKT